MVQSPGIELQFILFFDCPEDEMKRRVLGRYQVQAYSYSNFMRTLFEKAKALFFSFFMFSSDQGFSALVLKRSFSLCFKRRARYPGKRILVEKESSIGVFQVMLAT